MAIPDIQGVFEPRRNQFPPPPNQPTAPWKANFSLRTTLVMGGVLQMLVSLALPARYALYPIFLLTLHATTSFILRLATFDAKAPPPTPNPAITHDAPVPGAVTSWLPSPRYNPSSGETPFTHAGQQQGICTFHLSARNSHPLGNFAPGAHAIISRLVLGLDALRARAADYGFLGHSSWQGETRAAGNTGLVVLYFRDVEGLHRFAHDALHGEMMRCFWDLRGTKGYRHLGINHETFWSPPGAWETVNVDMPPTMLGAASVPVVNEETGGREWVSTLVSAEHPRLRTQWARMGRE